MTNTYGGESPSKTITRIKFWEAVRQLLGLRAFYSLGHLVLCGPDAGDVRVLHSMNARNIFAVDRHAQTVGNAAWSFTSFHPKSDVNWRAGKVERLTFGQKMGSVMLDWCSQITDGMLAKSFAVAQSNLSPRGVLGLGFMLGRDGMGDTPKDEDASQKRVAYVLRYIREHRLPFELSASWKYQSKTEDSQGVPMLYLLFTRKEGVKRGRPVKHFLVQKVEATRETVEESAQTLRSLSEWTDTQVADRFVIPYPRLAAWKASTTRRARAV